MTTLNVSFTSRIIIPARLASTRLPEKLLLRETGMTVLEHTYRAASKAQKPTGIVIAVDHQRIFDEVARFGGVAMMTDPKAASGTDRVAEVSTAHPEVDIWINVQGDEPEIEGEAIDQVLELLLDNPNASVATLATPIRKKSDLEDPACVKVVRSHRGEALYFSRSPIPHPRSWDESMLEQTPPLFLQHLGIYAYRRKFLQSLHQLPMSALENTEKLEQLRFLQADHKIMVGIVPHATRGIDTRADYDAFVKRLTS